MYHKSIETIPKCLRCFICAGVVRKPLTCIKCGILYCKGCYQIKKFCSFWLCHCNQTRKISVVDQIYLKEIKILCQICLVYVVGLNYSKHINQCVKTEQKKFSDNQKKLILVGHQNSLVLTQIKGLIEFNYQKDQSLNCYSLKSTAIENYCEQNTKKIRMLELKCYLCQISFNYFEIDQHISNCQEIYLNCDNKHCNWNGKRQNFNSHHLPCTQIQINTLSSIRQRFQAYNHSLNQKQLQTSFDRNQCLVDQKHFKDTQIYPHDFLTDYPQ